VTEKVADTDFAQVTAEWQLSKDATDHIEHWPADAKLQITYTLTKQELKATAKVSNPDTRPLPWGLGYHTYFVLPLAKSGSPDDVQVVIPASRRWHLEQFLPTGTKEALPASLDFRKGLPSVGLKADDVLTDLAHNADGRVESLLIDKSIGWEIVLSTPRPFSELVVFTPSWNTNSIALEPYTQTTDAINLAARGVAGGLRVLEPGQSETLDLRIISRKSKGETQ
jgi:aldose 1-epimerase